MLHIRTEIKKNVKHVEYPYNKHILKIKYQFK